MKKVLTLALFVLLLSAAADATIGQVLASYPNPAGSGGRGLARADAILYLVDNHNPGVVYRLNPLNGSILSWYTLPYAGVNAGLAYQSGGYLWVGNDTNNYVYRVNADTGSIYSSWNANHDPMGLDAQCTGDGGTGTSFILGTDSAPSAIFTHDLGTGSIISSVTISAASDYDCAFDWRNSLLWIGNMAGGYVMGYSPSGTLMGSFPTPGAYPSGMAYYGQYLFIGCSGDNRIYVVTCPQNFYDVAPASLGKVKVLYR